MRNTIGQRFQNRIDVPVWLERKQLTYAEKVLNIAYDTLIGYWPMWEPTGAIAYDLSSRGNNGAYTGVTLGQPGIGDGATSAGFDAATSFNNILSAGLIADFNGPEGSLNVPIRVSGAGVWTDATVRYGIFLRADGANFIYIRRSVVDNRLTLRVAAGGVGPTTDPVVGPTTDWVYAGLTWGGGFYIPYIDGIAVSAPVATGVWAGALTLAIIGAGSVAPINVWDGREAHIPLWTEQLSADRMLNLARP